MNEQKIYELLSSGNLNKENQGLKMLIDDKGYLIRKHSKQIPNHFNGEDKHSVFIRSIWRLLEKIRTDKFEWRGEGSLEKFLYSIIYREFQNEDRRRGKRLVELTTVHENQLSTSDKTHSEEILEQVNQIFQQQLGETCQQILLKYICEGMRHKGIAEEMKLTLGTVKNNSYKCMNKLKKLIEEDPNLGDYLKGLLED